MCNVFSHILTNFTFISNILYNGITRPSVDYLHKIFYFHICWWDFFSISRRISSMPKIRKRAYLGDLKEAITMSAVFRQVAVLHLVLVFHWGQGGDTCTPMLLSPTSVLREIIGILKRYSINKLLKDRNIINASQHSSVQNKPCQTNLLLLFDEISS